MYVQVAADLSKPETIEREFGNLLKIKDKRGTCPHPGLPRLKPHKVVCLTPGFRQSAAANFRMLSSLFAKVLSCLALCIL